MVTRRVKGPFRRRHRMPQRHRGGESRAGRYWAKFPTHWCVCSVRGGGWFWTEHFIFGMGLGDGEEGPDSAEVRSPDGMLYVRVRRCVATGL